jgi:hypothetical protein
MVDDLVLGRMTDFEDNEIPQEIISAEALFLHYQNQLLKLIKKRISKYELDFLINEIKTSDISFWREVIRRLASTYTLNPLRSFLTPSFTRLNFINETIKLLYLLKIELPEKLSENNIRNHEYFSRKEDFEKFLEEKNIKPVAFFKFSLRYIDMANFQEFIRKIVNESRLTYIE